jgi:hypothetical protein
MPPPTKCYKNLLIGSKIDGGGEDRHTDRKVISKAYIFYFRNESRLKLRNITILMVDG